jgi:hypothetical protein
MNPNAVAWLGHSMFFIPAKQKQKPKYRKGSQRRKDYEFTFPVIFSKHLVCHLCEIFNIKTSIISGQG